MSDDATPRLNLPYLAAAQAQKHVTMNEVTALLDSLVQTSVESRTVGAQPSPPGDGALYILPAGATGAAWAGRPADSLMRFEAGAWTVIEPQEGFVAFVKDEDLLVLFDGAAWRSAAPDELRNLTRLGVGTAADATNPFAAKLNKALWTAKTAAEGGDGDLRYTMNKEGAADVLSLLLQSGFSGRAELGLIGDDDLTLKVSADGAAWTTALNVDRANGQVSAAKGLTRVETEVFTAGGTYTVPAWARRLEVVCVGAGGGGGSGAAGDNSSARIGGAGAGSGGRASESFATVDLASSLTVAIGSGGAGASA